MITQFRELGSKKLLRDLYLTGSIPTVKTRVKIYGKYYVVVTVELDIDKNMWIIWLSKLK